MTSSAKAYYVYLLKQVRITYMQSFAESVRKQQTPLESSGGLQGDWKSFQEALRNASEYSGFLVANSLHWRATHSPIKKAESWSLRELAKRNPWIDFTMAKVTPIAEGKIREIMAAESSFIEKVLQRRQMPKPNQAVAHAEMLFRHATSEIANVAEQAQLELVGEYFPLGEYFTRDDMRVRPTHRQMYGFLAKRTHEVWSILRPPNGFNCRCFVRWITWAEAERRSLAKGRSLLVELRWPNPTARSNFELKLFPDEGFRGPKMVAA